MTSIRFLSPSLIRCRRSHVPVQETPMRFPFMLCLVLIAVLPTSAQEGRPSAETFAALVDRAAKDHGFSGAVIVAKGKDILYRGGVGLADGEWRGRNGPQTKFRLASLTKAFTAAMIMKLVDAGAVELDAPLTRYLDWYRRDTGDRVTIRNLLNHTSGIPSFTAQPSYESLKRRRIDVRKFAQAHCSGDLEFEPGSRFKYDNSGYFLLGVVIEEVTGKLYEVALDEALFSPLGMFSTGYDHGRADIPRRAKGYVPVAGTRVGADFIDMSVPFAAGALYSTVDDMLRWGRALLRGKVVSEASAREMFTPALQSYGFGWAIDTHALDRATPVRTIHHAGGIDGFATCIYLLPDLDAVVVVLSNVMDGMAPRFARQLARKVAGLEPRLPKRPMRERVWTRVHRGDVEGALRLVKDLPRRERGGFGLAAVYSAAKVLVGAGQLDAAAAVLRFAERRYPDSRNVPALLRRITKSGDRGIQFVEQMDVLPGPAVWSEAVHPIDIDGDGRLDLLFANCNGWHRPGDMAAPNAKPLRPTLLMNEGSENGVPRFKDVSADVFPEDLAMHAKNAAVCDVNGDGHSDVVFAVAFGGRPRLLLWEESKKRFVDATASHLPDVKLNANGVGFGDLDDDGDLDLVFADSGPKSDREPGGRARLFLNDGKGHFTEAADRFPSEPKVGAQNAKILDIDGDLDLDVVVDGKSRVTQLYINDGKGRFELDTKTIPMADRGGQPYEIEWADLDGDGDLDAVHMNWGGGRRQRYRNVVLKNLLVESGRLAFEVVEDALDLRNNEDENEFAFLDADDDGDLDLVTATLLATPGSEKLYLNSGTIGSGFLRLSKHAFSELVDGTLDLCIADFDGDGARDVVTAQGESDRFESFHNRHYKNMGPRDTRPPRIIGLRVTNAGNGMIVKAMVRDDVADDGESRLKVWVTWSGEAAGFSGSGSNPMTYMGGGLYRGVVPPGVILRGADASRVRVHAEDAAGNQSVR